MVDLEAARKALMRRIGLPVVTLEDEGAPPRCATCRWAKNPNPPTDALACARVHDYSPETLARVFADDVYLRVSPSFGCVQHEARP